jgi:flagellar basal body-associated protein FliL
MEPIAIVKKRSHIWMIMIALIIVALLAAAAFWFLSGRTVTDVSQVPWIGHFAAAPATIAVPPGA